MSIPTPLTSEEKALLLQAARQAIERALGRPTPAPPKLADFPPALREAGASFVTLTRRGELRGCIGALEAYQPLAEDVQEHAVAAALEDYRFPPLTAAELPEIAIEVSRLTAPQRFEYRTPQELLDRLRPGVDGVILRDGPRRATFLPQVWEKLPDPAAFLDHLCQKMGVAPGYWRRKLLDVFVYQVEEFHE